MPVRAHDPTEAAGSGPPAAAAAALAALRPVPVPAAVWTNARQAFAAPPLAQLPARARLLDVLAQLEAGHLLVFNGHSVWLLGQPDIALFAGLLFRYRYVALAGHHRDNPAVVYFCLSEAGRRKLAEGRAWWCSLTLLQRLRVRLLG